jgi:hypothetical protein
MHFKSAHTSPAVSAWAIENRALSCAGGRERTGEHRISHAAGGVCMCVPIQTGPVSGFQHPHTGTHKHTTSPGRGRYDMLHSLVPIYRDKATSGENGT